jgi:hypothetical protein
MGRDSASEFAEDHLSDATGLVRAVKDIRFFAVCCGDFGARPSAIDSVTEGAFSFIIL